MLDCAWRSLIIIAIAQGLKSPRLNIDGAVDKKRVASGNLGSCLSGLLLHRYLALQ